MKKILKPQQRQYTTSKTYDIPAHEKVTSVCGGIPATYTSLRNSNESSLSESSTDEPVNALTERIVRFLIRVGIPEATLMLVANALTDEITATEFVMRMRIAENQGMKLDDQTVVQIISGMIMEAKTYNSNEHATQEIHNL